MKDWTDFVRALTQCGNEHFYGYDADDVRERVVDIGDPGCPCFVARTYVECPRCGDEHVVRERARSEQWTTQPT